MKLATRLLEGATFAAYVAWVGFALWRYLDPDADPGATMRAAGGELRRWRQHRAAVSRTLADIRDLPEREAGQ